MKQIVVGVLILLAYLQFPILYSVNANNVSCSDGSSACCKNKGCKCDCGETCIGTWCTIACNPCGGCSSDPDPSCGGGGGATNTPRPPTNTPGPPTNTPIPRPTNTPDPSGGGCQNETNCGPCGDYYDGSSGCWKCKTSCSGGGNTPTPIPATPTPVPPSRIQGFKVRMPGSVIEASSTPISSSVITLDGTTTSSANQYLFTTIAGPHTVSAAIPSSGPNYSIGYTLCPNNITCHASSLITLGSSVGVNSLPNEMVDLKWYYYQYDSWYRLKHVSLHKQASPTTRAYNFIPPIVVRYDNYDTNQVMLNIDETDILEGKGVGVVTASSVIDLGPNTSRLSPRNLGKANYAWSSRGYLDDLPGFITHARANKKIKIISALSEIESDRINILSGNAQIDTSSINASLSNFVLIVEGDLLINSAPGNVFNTTRRSMALIATGKITINPAITEVNAILIANSFNLGTGTTPLKIVGNLISATPVNTEVRSRIVADYQKASVYVVFSPTFYIDLMPYLSTIIQEGKQLQ